MTNKWENLAKNHPLNETLLQARELAYREIEDIDSKHELEQMRLIKVIDKIQSIVDGIDPDFFHKETFDQINSQLNHHNFLNQLKSYSKTGDMQNIVTANNHITAQLPRIFSLSGMARAPEAREEINNAERAFEEFCKVVEKKIKEIDDDISKFKSDLESINSIKIDLGSSLEELKKKASIQFDEWVSEFSSEQARRQAEHSDSETSRRQEFEGHIKEFRERSEDKLKEITSNFSQAFEEKFDNFKEEMEKKRKDIEEKHKSILDIHELVATDGVAGGYKKNADDERDSANNWRMISMACYSIILLWVLFKGFLGFEVYVDGYVQWPVIITTLSITAVAFVAAQFASRQSRIHRVNEQRMRWFSLEVKAIDPFISSLPTDQQHELKRQLSERLFGKDRIADDGQKNNSNEDSSSISKLVESLNSLIDRR